MTAELNRPVRPDITGAVNARLFADADANVFAILDGASVPDLRDALYRMQPEHVCLYRGELAPDMAEVAPYLVRLERDSEFAEWVIEKGWGNHWGIFAEADADLHTLRQHFRRFLTVHDSDGKPLIFRYYDPRVMRVYLPTCNAEELAAIFGPVSAYLLEGAVEGDSPGTLLRFEAASGALAAKEEKLD